MTSIKPTTYDFDFLSAKDWMGKAETSPQLQEKNRDAVVKVPTDEVVTQPEKTQTIIRYDLKGNGYDVLVEGQVVDSVPHQVSEHLLPQDVVETLNTESGDVNASLNADDA